MTCFRATEAWKIKSWEIKPWGIKPWQLFSNSSSTRCYKQMLQAEMTEFLP